MRLWYPWLLVSHAKWHKPFVINQYMTVSIKYCKGWNTITMVTLSLTKYKRSTNELVDSYTYTVDIKKWGHWVLATRILV